MPAPFSGHADAPSKTITVVQGEYHVSSDPNVVLSTILGSCVSVCIFDPHAGIGGMNHFYLPNCDGDATTNVKYGSFAMEILITELIEAGADRFKLQAKIFGGASMITTISDIGASNVLFGRTFLNDEGIECVSESVGGNQARRVQFVPVNGAARQRFVASNEVEVTAPPVVPQTADITLF